MTAESLGSQERGPRATSPRRLRICEVSGATTTRDRASFSLGTARTRTGRFLAARPRSANQTSLGRALVLTQRAGPNFGLLIGREERAGTGGHGEREVPTKGYLGEKQVHRVPGFEAEGAKDFFGGLQVGAIHTGPQKRGSLHDINMLKNAYFARRLKTEPNATR